MAEPSPEGRPGHGPARRAARFPTTTELVAAARALTERHPLHCRLRRVGTSRGGAPLLLLSVGRGSRSVLVVAGAHANEPVGGATIRYLAERLCRRPETHEEEDTRWHFLLCLDPDGARRNDPWIRDGATGLPAYYRRFFRPCSTEQPEWLPPPGGGAPLPETRALTALLDDLRPVLQCSLHGVELGGSWVQLTRPLPGLGGPLRAHADARGIPLERGPFDAFYWDSPEPGTYLMPPPGRPDQFGALPDETARSTWFHPWRYGTLTGVVEVPMWADPRVEDTAPHPAAGPALAAVSARLREQCARVTGLLPAVRTGRPAADLLLPALTETLTVAPGLAAAWDPVGPPGDGPPLPPMTRARVAALDVAGRRLTLRAAGLLLQALDGDQPEHATVRRLIDDWCAEYRRSARPVPVADQVAHQAGVVLALADRALHA
ncbi:dehydrogenase [Streptomyces sp. JJ36]|nr:dehydrogenase [Streptomyces sp. JJ36]